MDQSRNLKHSGIAPAGFAWVSLARSRLTLPRLAGRGMLVVALVAACGLAGCGRKAGLDAPPLAAAPDQQAGQPGTAQASGPDGKPVAAVTDKRHSIFDWLIN